ncbi:AAA family ATPase [Paradesulfitobacterium aromaticivorans]
MLTETRRQRGGGCVLSLEILGPPRVLRSGQPLRVGRRKSRALLYYIAAHSSALSREHALAFLWPDQDRLAAQRALGATLHELRKTMGDALRADNDTLAVAAEVAIDAHLFEERLSPPVADLELLTATLNLYRGDFLEGFSLPDLPEFDNWAVAERERYRRLTIRGLTAVAEQHEKRKNYLDALEALNRALEFDPLQEDLYCACMRLHCLAGDRAGAIRRFEKLRGLLDQEMGVPPMPQTQALYEAIITDKMLGTGDQYRASACVLRDKRPARSGPLQVSTPLPFVGREAELSALRGLALGAEPGFALIEGEPGIGKTRLVEEFLRESGALTIRGTAHELEQILPYQPIVEMLRGILFRPDWTTLDSILRTKLAPVWRAEIDRLLPEMAGSSAPDQRNSIAMDERRLWEAVKQFLFVLADQQPVIVFLDDIHWADASTLGLLGYLLRQKAEEPIMFVATTRHFTPRSSLGALLHALDRGGLLLRFPLSRLEHDDVTAVAHQLSTTNAHMLAEWLARTSEGNPYILAELVRHAREIGLLLADGEMNMNVLSAAPVVPQTVRSFIRARLEHLSEAARCVLDTAAVVGQEFEFKVVARAVALSESAAVDGLDELVAAGLVRLADGNRYTFDHSLTMEVAGREIGKARRQSLHRRIAEALESIYHDRLEGIAGLLAWHFGEGDAPDRAKRYALRAGNRATRLGAYTEAIAFYEQALAGSDEKEQIVVLSALGETYFLAGQSARTAEVYRRAAAIARSRGDAALAERYLGAALMVEKVDLKEFFWGATPLLEGADLAEAANHFRTADALYGEESDVEPKILAQIKIGLGLIAAQQGDLPQAIACYQAALAVAMGSRDQDTALDQIVVARINLSHYLYLIHDTEALEHALSGLHLAHEKGLLEFHCHLLSILGEIELARGDLEAAERYFTEGLDMAERQVFPYHAARLKANLGRLARERGYAAEAVQQLSSALASADALGTRHLVAQIRQWLILVLPPTETHIMQY